MSQIFTEPHSTKQIEDCVGWGLETSAETLIATVENREWGTKADVLAACADVRCPVLVIHGSDDAIRPHESGRRLAEATSGELVTLQGSGHSPHARDPVKVNLLLRDFVDPPPPKTSVWTRGKSRSRRRALYISSPIGLGHAQRDVAIAKELRRLVPDLEIDWLAQHPVTKVLEGEGERIHPMSAELANESGHMESESAEHDLHCFQAWRRMDEILVANFMVFHDIVRENEYDLWIGDEAWELDYYLHENPELKSAAYVWLTDFVGWLPMEDGGSHESYLTADYNAEMIEHIDRFPRVRDRALFVGNREDVVQESFGAELPMIRDWTDEHFDFTGYITGFDPGQFADRTRLRAELGYGDNERVCVVTRRRLGRRRPPAAAGDRRLPRGQGTCARPANDRRLRPAHRPAVAAGGAGARSGDLRSQPLPPSGRVRPRRGPGRPDHVDGADRGAPTLPLLPPAPPLRAELPRPPPPRALRGRAPHGLRRARRRR